METKYKNTLIIILLGLSFIWLHAALEKLTSGIFPETMNKTLQYFASKNQFPLYKSFLLNFATPNSYLFGILVEFGELFVGVGVLGISYAIYKNRLKANKICAAFAIFLVGLFLNINFYFAAGWTSPAASSLNLLMGIIEIAFLYFLTRDKKE